MATANPKMKCPHCGKFSKKDLVFCFWCGEKIGEISGSDDNEQEIATSTLTPVPVSESSPSPATASSNTREFVKSSSLGGNKNVANNTTIEKQENKKQVVESKHPIVDEIIDDIEDDDEVDDDISDEEAEYRKLEEFGDDETAEIDEDEVDIEEDGYENEDPEDSDGESDDDDAFYKALSGQGSETSEKKKKSMAVVNSLGKLKDQGAEVLSQTVNQVKTSTENHKADKNDKSSKKQSVKETTTKMQTTYNPNYDGYYNDLCEIVDAKVDSISKDSLIRTITLIFILVVIIIGMIYYI